MIKTSITEYKKKENFKEKLQKSTITPIKTHLRHKVIQYDDYLYMSYLKLQTNERMNSKTDKIYNFITIIIIVMQRKAILQEPQTTFYVLNAIKNRKNPK